MFTGGGLQSLIDYERWQDLVLAASNDAAKKVDDESQKKMGGMLGGLGLPPGLF